MAEPHHPSLQRLNSDNLHTFKVPAKLINEGGDLSTFLVSRGYHDIVTFLGQLNRSVFPQKGSAKPTTAEPEQASNHFSPTVTGIRKLLDQLDRFIDQAPPDPGPRRFGNVSFRKWFELAQTQSRDLLQQHLPDHVTSFRHIHDVDSADAIVELSTYFLGGFGSAQRLDYGTGHELSFIAFLAGVWKLGGFNEGTAAHVEREIVLGVVQRYLELVRKLILTYNLEPAGTHGVWGLDDHSFVPYIFGSAQYGPEISGQDPTPIEGSLAGAPDPGDVAKADKVQALRNGNMYFGAIGFIYDVKKGPFWEHSPTLYDISGVKAGWGKINKGMMKMYNAEVLSKFPVVQHFPFGSLFEWEQSPKATRQIPDVHAQSQPRAQRHIADTKVPGPIDVTSTMAGTQAGLTRAPWASGGVKQGVKSLFRRPSQRRGTQGSDDVPSTFAVEAPNSTATPQLTTKIPGASLGVDPGHTQPHDVPGAGPSRGLPPPPPLFPRASYPEGMSATSGPLSGSLEEVEEFEKSQERRASVRSSEGGAADASKAQRNIRSTTEGNAGHK